MWLKIAATFGELLIKLGLKKKKEADASKADAMEKTMESVNESLEVEKKVRDDQKDVDRDPSDVETVDGSIEFEKPKEEE